MGSSGAGIHKSSQFNDLKMMIKECLKSSSDSIEAVQFMERNPMLNAGFGKHKKFDECDASIFTEDSFASIASLPPSEDDFTPIEIVGYLLERESILDKSLCGSQVYDLLGSKIKNQSTQKLSENTNSNSSLVSDTVGAICDNYVCSSSSGPKNKLPGRIGPASMPGCTNYKTSDISIMASGSGPILTNSILCASLFFELIKPQKEYLPADEIVKEFVCRKTKHDRGSILGVIVKQNNEVIAVHNSPTFLFGFKSKNKLKSIISE